MHLLVVDDDKDIAYILQQTLLRHRYQADIAFDGEEALSKIRREKFDVLLVDWMLPKMDGIELIRQVRKSATPAPVILMLTSIGLPSAKEHALKAGADDYIAKPCDPKLLMQRIQEAMNRRAQPAPAAPKLPVKPKPRASPPPAVGVVIATSTGGPVALKQILRDLPDGAKEKAAFFLVLHGPDWMLASLADYLKDAAALRIQMAEDGLSARKGCLYVAPSGKHLVVTPENLEMRLTETARENFMRPSADPLFRSAAEAFGPYCVAVILTGMGRDGAQGASHVAAAQGTVLVQDPDTAVAPAMPTTAIQAGLAGRTPALDDMGEAIGQEISRLDADLQAAASRPS